jgi:hypothetical protein
LSGVSDNGTFIINVALDPANPAPWSSGRNGIPSGWTVKRASNPPSE